MKVSKNIDIRIVGIIFLCTMLAGGAYAQESSLRWSKWSQGHNISGGGGLPDNVVDSYVDSAGNCYIFGRCGKDARLGENGPYYCPMDSVSGGYTVGNAYGIFLAKIDSAGTILWCKSVRGATQNHLTVPWNMVVKGDRITIGFDTRFSDNPYVPNGGYACWLYFFDTLIRTSGDHFYLRDYVTYFVTFDLDGNQIDIHDVRLWARVTPEFPDFRTCRLGGLGDSRFGIDNDGSIHIFSCTTASGISEDSLHKAYIIVDDDTNRKYPLNIHTQGNRSCFPNVYYKMSSDWRLLDWHYMIDTVAGWQPLGPYSMATLYVSNILVDGEDLYVNGYFSS